MCSSDLLAGQFINKEPDSQDTDEWAISNGYISIVPIKADMTDTNFLNTLKNKLYDI